VNLTREEIRLAAKLGSELTMQGTMAVPGTVQRSEGDAVFRVYAISNGFIAIFTDIEEYDVKVPVFVPRAPGHPGLGRGGGPSTFETRRKWKLAYREVYCADAQALKAAIDESLKLANKVKQMKAQDILSGEDEYGPTALEA